MNLLSLMCGRFERLVSNNLRGPFLADFMQPFCVNETAVVADEAVGGAGRGDAVATQPGLQLVG